MPVLAHRSQWTGGIDLLVGVSVNKDEGPVAFSPDGVRTQLNRDAPPMTP